MESGSFVQTSQDVIMNTSIADVALIRADASCSSADATRAVSATCILPQRG
jgi:hypothetical protein